LKKYILALETQKKEGMMAQVGVPLRMTTNQITALLKLNLGSMTLGPSNFQSNIN
jgi:hypothetical protein